MNTKARAGDWVEARGIHGEPARRGQILDVLGRPGHERYHVRWDEQHESIMFPADGVNIVTRVELSAGRAVGTFPPRRRGRAPMRHGSS
jgi:hypothetical protein